MNRPSEGVIKFALQHRTAPALPAQATRELRAWFLICRQTGLLGQDARRYDGWAYGNLSRRWAAGFVITCTQTSGQQALTNEDFALVESFDILRNSLSAHGPCQASSEAMTHGIIYRTLPRVGAVFHAHSPEIWQHAAELNLAVTDPDAEYGTPEMAGEVKKLLQRQDQPAGIFSMGGHEDGIVSYAPDAEQAGLLMIQTLARALIML